ncbi:alpha/beta fold hydrolase [Fictibacillus fluitans]|uniref:Alpha/beta hydrolase n=1 Tax=Fictibacillus fluitans TaxID=3058422 RepID=A0ABT8HUN7_9BACL|nr:alpha/beta hydrolase [Fictibacillus sp. NE201]MDN4523982.1 alpha/beta hydrolase [Fictibacillus sp. NE201]
MFKEDYVKVNGVNLHYVEKGEGELMLFLHGFPYFWHCWHNQLEEFSKDYRVVAVDMRGYNTSDKPEDISSYEMPVLLEDVKQLIEAFGEKECILVGHDWGGAIAWTFAYTHPEYIKKLIIFDAPHPYTFHRELVENPAQREASSYMGFFQKPDSHDVLLADNSERLRKMMNTLGLDLTQEEEEKYLEAWQQPEAMKSMLNYYRAASFYPFEKLAQQPVALPHRLFESPALIIWGNADIAFENSNLNGIEEYAPNITIHRLNGVGHAPQLEKPEETNAFMREFLQQDS